MKIETGGLAPHQFREQPAFARPDITSEKQSEVTKATEVAKRFQGMVAGGIRKEGCFHIQWIGPQPITLLESRKQAATVMTVEPFVIHRHSLSFP